MSGIQQAVLADAYMSNFVHCGNTGGQTSGGSFGFGMDFGFAMSGRRIIVLAYLETNIIAASADINGVGATIHATANGADCSAALLSALEGTITTTGLVTVNWTGVPDGTNCYASIYADRGGRAISTTATDISTPSASLNLNVTGRGVTVGGVIGRGTATPSGPTSSGFYRNNYNHTNSTSMTSLQSFEDPFILEAASPKSYSISWSIVTPDSGLAAVNGHFV